MNERISFVRKQTGLTQEEFGARIGGLSKKGRGPQAIEPLWIFAANLM